MSKMARMTPSSPNGSDATRPLRGGSRASRGASSAGEYAHTLQRADVASGWSERMVLLNRGQVAMEGGFRTALARLPFALVALHPGNGREFFDDHLKRLFPQLVPGLPLSRSRPYHKNDNRFVEQKNDVLVRRYVGYARFDTPEQVAALYADMSVYYNLVLHLVEYNTPRKMDHELRWTPLC